MLFAVGVARAFRMCARAAHVKRMGLSSSYRFSCDIRCCAEQHCMKRGQKTLKIPLFSNLSPVKSVSFVSREKKKNEMKSIEWRPLVIAKFLIVFSFGETTTTMGKNGIHNWRVCYQFAHWNVWEFSLQTYGVWMVRQVHVPHLICRRSIIIIIFSIVSLGHVSIKFTFVQLITEERKKKKLRFASAINHFELVRKWICPVARSRLRKTGEGWREDRRRWALAKSNWLRALIENFSSFHRRNIISQCQSR